MEDDIDISNADEHVEINIDSPTSALGAPRQRQRTAECVSQTGRVQPPVNLDDPARQARHGCPSWRPKIGHSSFREWRAGNSPASSSTWASSSPFVMPGTGWGRGRSRTSRSKFAARTIRSSVVTEGTFLPDSYAESVECDVPARAAAWRRDTPDSRRAERRIWAESM